jgi:predicted nucleic acid-binding protein
MFLASEIDADWLLMDDLAARRAAAAHFAALGARTVVKGTLGVIVSAYLATQIPRPKAIQLVEAIRGRPDIWIAAELCLRVIEVLGREAASNPVQRSSVK